MSAPSVSARWVLGLWLASGVGLGLYLRHQQAEQLERFEQLNQELKTLQRALAELKRAPAPAAPLQPASLPPEAPRGGVDLVATEALARRVAELVSAQLPPASAARAEPPEPEPRPAPTREQQAALARAQQVLEGALARGRLNREDVQEMSRQLALASDPEAHEAIRRRIVTSINTNKLIPEDPRFVFP